MTIIAAPAFGVLEKEAGDRQHGGTDAPDAKETDKATDWLNENSAGTGPYRLTGWQRNQQIQMVRNPNYWNGTPGYDRVLIRHMSESAAQLLAIQRGDIDVAFNLHPGADRHAEGRSEHRGEGHDQPRLHLHGGGRGADEPGAAEQAGAAGHRLRHRLRRHHQQPDRRQRGASGELPAGRRQRLDRGADQGDRLPRGPRKVEAAAGGGRDAGRLQLRSSPTATPRSPASATRAWRRSSRRTWRASASGPSWRRWTRSTCGPCTWAASSRRC